MFKALVNGERVSLAEAFRSYGADVTKWPTPPICPDPDCGKKLHPWGVNILLAGDHIERSGEHRLAVSVHPRFDHYKGEGLNCSHGTRDRSPYEDLNDSIRTPGAAARFKAECLKPENEARTIAMMGFILGCKSNRKNFSLATYLSVLEIADEKKMWEWNIPAWFTPYALVQQCDFVRRTEGDGFLKVRYVREEVPCLPGLFDPSSTRDVIATYFASGKKEGTKTYIRDVPISEDTVGGIYAAHKPWADHKVKELQAKYADHPVRRVKVRNESAQDLVTVS